MKMLKHKVGTDRGVALLIVLLITALLVALVFEFAYGTRVSLRAAVNFRDSQRAFFLARSGIKVFIKYNELRESTQQGEWSVIPIVSAGDTELRIRWEDEKGKINIKGFLTTDDDTVGWIESLFMNEGIDSTVLYSLKDHFKGRQIQLLGELREVMSDEDFSKVAKSLTVYSGQKMININTASEDVLRSLGIEPALIMPLRPIGDRANIPAMETVKTKKGSNVKDFLDVASAVYTVYSYATVGDYTEQVEAVVNSGAVQYWKAL